MKTTQGNEGVSQPASQPMLLDSRAKSKRQNISKETDHIQHRCALEHSMHFKGKVAQSQRAIKKLVLVSIVCTIFCTVEAVGGILSGSLAILTDAAHQLSDVAGFVISFIAIYISTRQSNLKNSYGYHRADVIGALASILIIWGLLGWLISEAIYRIQHPTDINGELMLITACIGLGCNILNLVVLHFCCNVKDEDGEAVNLTDSIASAYRPRAVEKQLSSSSLGKALKQRSASYAPRSQHIFSDDENPTQALLSSHSPQPETTARAKIDALAGKLKNQSEMISNDTSQLKLMRQLTQQSTKQDQETNCDYKVDSEEKSEKDIDMDFSEEGSKARDEAIQEHKELLKSRKTRSRLLSKSLAGPQQQNNFDDDVSASADEPEIEIEETDSVAEKEADNEKEGAENLNIRAAMVHMIGDMIQSIGVIIAAIIIYVKPEWTIADPICTFLFSILVLFTTVPIFLDCLRILMEASPSDVDNVGLFNALNQLECVDEVHDFHVWSLSQEKPILSAHIVTKTPPSEALYQVTSLLQNEFGIYHSTIQIEPAKTRIPGILGGHIEKQQDRCLNEHHLI